MLEAILANRKQWCALECDWYRSLDDGARALRPGGEGKKGRRLARDYVARENFFFGDE
jgi:hypothetical protein